MFFFFPRSALWAEVPDPPSKGINEEARTRSLLFPRRGSKVPTRFPAKRLHLVCGCWRLSGIGQVGWPAEPAGAQHGVPRCTPPPTGEGSGEEGKGGRQNPVRVGAGGHPFGDARLEPPVLREPLPRPLLQDVLSHRLCPAELTCSSSRRFRLTACPAPRSQAHPACWVLAGALGV